MPKLLILLLIFVVFDAVIRLRKFYDSASNIYFGDESFHFAFCQEIKKNRHRIPDKPSYALKATLPYPFFYHWFLSFFSKEWVRKNGGAISIFFEELILVLMGITAYLLGVNIGASKNTLLYIVFISVVIWTINPLNWGYNPLSPYQNRISPRSAGKFFTGTGCLFLILGLSYRMPIFLILSTLMIMFATLISKFSIQVLLFNFLGFSLVRFDIMPLILLLAGLCLAFIFSFGSYFKVLKGHLKHLINYYRYVKDVHPGTTADYSFKLSHIFQIILKPGWESFKLFLSDPFLRQVLFWVPQLLLITIGFLLFRHQEVGELIKLLWTWLAINLFLWLAVLSPKLKFIGEADRYMEYSGNISLNVLTVFVLLSFYPRNLMIAIVFTIFLIAYPITTLFFLRKMRYCIDDEETKKELKKIDDLPAGIILGLPIAGAADFIISHGITKHKFPTGLVILDTSSYLEFFDTYPFTDKKIDGLINKYSIDYLIIFKERHPELKFHDLSKHKLFFNGNKIAIYIVKKQICP